MSSLVGAAAQLPPEFWLAVPAVLSVLLFGAVALAAVIRARPEDVPKVLSIFSAIFTRRAGDRFIGTDKTESLTSDECGQPMPRLGHHGSAKQKGKVHEPPDRL